MFKKRKTYSLDELNAFRVAYGNPLERKEIFSTLFIAFLIAGIYTFALFYYWWLALIVGGLGVFYAYRFILPDDVKRVYEVNAFRERNNFINNITQILTNPDRTVLEALKIVEERANGEFKEDLVVLQASLMNANKEEIQQAFQELGKKYEHDVIFDMYIEQLTTAAIEGRTNVETLKDIKTYHNEIKKRQDSFMNAKKREAYNFKFITVIGFVLIMAISFSFGWEQFVTVYAHSPIGWVTSGIYLILLGGFYNSFRKRLVDDNIMEVKI
ncbi:hypothetical protein [Metabacillus niabensis]|uniref:hypothetical protein n=1 Tax=Metabacillus niabensis TaxID=324854 RepID=UPI0039A30461